MIFTKIKVGYHINFWYIDLHVTIIEHNSKKDQIPGFGRQFVMEQ